MAIDREQLADAIDVGNRTIRSLNGREIDMY